MEKEQENIPEENTVKTGPNSNPVNKFKEGSNTSAAALDNIISSPVANVKAKSGSGFANEGTVADYEEEK